MKPQPSELPRVVEDQRATALMQDEVIVFAGLEAGFFHAQSAGHAEMHTEPEVFEKAEEHLLAVRLGGLERRAGQEFFQRMGVAAAKNSFPRMQRDSPDFSTQSGIPLFAVKFDFSQFRHGRRVGR